MALPPPIASVAQGSAVSSDNDSVRLRRADNLSYEVMISDLRTKIRESLTLSTAPYVAALTETHAASEFTDGTAAIGTLTMTGSIPAGAEIIRSHVLVPAGFAGDVSCVMTIGDGSDVDRYNTGTLDIFTTAATGIASTAPSGLLFQIAAVQPVLTITSNADITPVIAGAGSVTVTILYIATV